VKVFKVLSPRAPGDTEETARMTVMWAGFELCAVWMQLHVPALCGFESRSKEKKDSGLGWNLDGLSKLICYRPDLFADPIVHVASAVSIVRSSNRYRCDKSIAVIVDGPPCDDVPC
jgi:hypothetical protein